MTSTPDELARFRLDGTRGDRVRWDPGHRPPGSQPPCAGRWGEDGILEPSGRLHHGSRQAGCAGLGCEARLFLHQRARSQVDVDAHRGEHNGPAVRAGQRRRERGRQVGAGAGFCPAGGCPEAEWDRILDLNLRSDLLADPGRGAGDDPGGQRRARAPHLIGPWPARHQRRDSSPMSPPRARSTR